MLSPRRAIKLWKVKEIPNFKETSFFDMSSAQPADFRKSDKVTKKYRKIDKPPLKFLEFHVESPEGNKIKEIPNFKETSFFDMSSAQPDRFRAVFNCFRIVFGQFSDRFGPFRTDFAPFFFVFSHRGGAARPQRRHSAAAAPSQRRRSRFSTPVRRQRIRNLSFFAIFYEAPDDHPIIP